VFRGRAECWCRLVSAVLVVGATALTDQGITWKESVVVTGQRRQDARFDALSVESGSRE
jgi:hypothetical protein